MGRREGGGGGGYTREGGRPGAHRFPRMGRCPGGGEEEAVGEGDARPRSEIEEGAGDNMVDRGRRRRARMKERRICRGEKGNFGVGRAGGVKVLSVESVDDAGIKPGEGETEFPEGGAGGFCPGKGERREGKNESWGFGLGGGGETRIKNRLGKTDLGAGTFFRRGIFARDPSSRSGDFPPVGWAPLPNGEKGGGRGFSFLGAGG